MSSVIPHLMSLADLSTPQIKRLLIHAKHLKTRAQLSLPPKKAAMARLAEEMAQKNKKWTVPEVQQTLDSATIALLFSKRSTRTRVAAESAAKLLGGQALFLGKDDIQLGVNESARDTARVISGMCQGIFARVGEHEEIEELAKYSRVPVINALSSYWHPTQVLADLLTLHEIHTFHVDPSMAVPDPRYKNKFHEIRPLTVAYVGDSANVLHDMLVTYPRLGHKLQVASPPQYRPPKAVWDAVTKLGCDAQISWSEDPKAAVKDADVVVTDTWISMGQEAETEQRLKDFQGYQVTEQLCKDGGANPNWIFLHCLPRKKYEVDDDVFYGPRSRVFHEADNRKWTIMALFDQVFGKWSLMADKRPSKNERGQPKPKDERERIQE